MREEGYYWVSINGAMPRVFECSDGVWWLIGDEESYGDSSKIQPIGERLEPPGIEMEKK